MSVENSFSNRAESIQGLIAIAAGDQPGSLALLAPNRLPLTYKNLLQRIQDVAASLTALGLGPGDCIATVLPDGPEAAVAILAISAFAACAPINAACQPGELELHLRTLVPSAVVILSGAEVPSRVAKSLGLPLIEISPLTNGHAGAFTMAARGRRRRPAGNLRPDAAMILPTSGTTSRPKLAIHTQRSLYWATVYLARALALSRQDRCLNLAPLAHSLGLTGSLLASIASGGSTVCIGGFRTRDFFRWLDEFSPTWYGAVPAIHEAILKGAAENREVLSRTHLRFIRAAGAPCPPQLRAQVEQAMGCPFVVTYGMSEAPPIAMDPLPPARSKVGSVGLPAGPSVEVVDDHGNPVPRGETGEIVVRGPNVVVGYWNNPAANRDAFVDGWFRTGDQGYMDSDGFLFLTGRIKDLINRGGEKIAPSEVDEALMEHPAVAQAVTFAVPDGKLGEEIGVAVVWRENTGAGAANLQAFAASRLTAQKIPRHFFFLKEIPRNSAGKISRTKLSQTLAPGLSDNPAPPGSGSIQLRPPIEAPSSDRERLFAGIWSSVLGIDEVGIHDNFFDCGGDSIRGAELLSRLSQAVGIEMPPLSVLLVAPTIAALSRVIDDSGYLAASSRIAPIQTHGARTPFFCIGDGVEFRHMATHLDGYPTFAIRTHRFEQEPPPLRIEALTARCRETLRSVQPRGPYRLGGWCFAGVVAFELARQLEELGEEVSLVALFDARNLFPSRVHGIQRVQNSWNTVGAKLRFHLRNVYERGFERGLTYAAIRARTVTRRAARKVWSMAYRYYSVAGRPMPALLRSPDFSQALALSDYVPRPISARIVLFLAAERPEGGQDPESQWAALTRAGLEFYETPGDHVSMLQEPSVSLLASKLRECLSEPAAVDSGVTKENVEI
ncbi:MAG TPA: AMP-binding protein [Bryobacteraceae bacterium]|nr:AMP-binding protein [Bryobacteraceae bacterium]